MKKNIKEELLSKFALAYNNDGLPPLAGKVLGLFYISDNKYFSFEDIIKEIKSSKGATSKVLKLLMERGQVNFIYSEEKWKKRLFYLDINGVISYLDRILENYNFQNQLLKQSKSLRTNKNPELNKFIDNSIEFNNEVLKYLILKTDQHFKS